MLNRILWNKGWGFIPSDYEAVKDNDFDASALDMIDIPHDWSVTMPFCRDEEYRACGFLPGGIGWYRKEFYLEQKEVSKVRRHLLLEGVFNIGTVYINGKAAGSRPYGYFPAIYDITVFLKAGLNVVAIKVDNSLKAASRWYNGSGIFRNVWLLESAETYIPQSGIWVRTPVVEPGYAEIEARVSVVSNEGSLVGIRCRVIDENGIGVAEGEATPDEDREYVVCFKLDKPRLWSTENPVLYTLSVSLTADGKMLDREQVVFGIRRLDWISGKGFYLNHVPTKLKGVCLHQDIGIIGAATTEAMIEQRLILLKQMGCNAIRPSHNLWAPVFYDLCDRMGFMVMDEIFDGWETAKAKSDYGLFFKDWHERDITTFIRRDRNHPSVIIWGIGNEITDMSTETLMKIKGIVQKLDPDRPLTCAIQGVGEQSDVCRALLPIAGYNDGGGACFIYERDHQKRPEQLMVATESPHTLHTRGFYRTQTWWRDKNQPRKEIENLCEEEIFFDGGPNYNSSYDNSGVRFSARDSWRQTEKLDYLIGEFRWLGFDYYGESGGWPVRSVGMGVIDTAGIPKDHYYLYQSMWFKKEDNPVLHVLPHWTHHSMKRGTVIPVWVYTNCDVVELFLNGISLGKREWREERFIQYDVPYEPGRLTAIAFIDGKTVKKMEYQTADLPKQLKMEWVNRTVCRKREDPHEIRVTILDEHGVEVPHAESAVTFFGTDYQILGTENGDHTDLTPLTSRVRKAFYGKCTTLAVKSYDRPSSELLYAASVLGERYFEEMTEVTIDVQAIDGLGEQKRVDCQIWMRINEGDWRPYYGSFSICDSSVIEAEVRVSDQPSIKIRGALIKGIRPPYVDLIHGNREVTSDVPAGPFSDKMTGTWKMGEQLLEFHSDGCLDLAISNDNKQKVGYWWYDFPVDVFEAQEYAGTGEIWFLSGERAVLRMETQQAETVIIDNREFGFHTAYVKEEQLLIRRV